MNNIVDNDLLPAWTDSVHAAQATFRAVLHALSEPGTVCELPVEVLGPAPLLPAATAVCLALADFETPVWLDAGAANAAVHAYLRFHCGCPITDEPSAASFAVVSTPASMSFACFAQGTMDYPDRSATLLVQVTSLTDGPVRRLAGPGIRDTAELRVSGLASDFEERWRENAAGFPLGIDIVFCCGNRIVGLPRTTQFTQLAEHTSCM